MKRFIVLLAALVVSATFTLTSTAGPKSGGGGAKPKPSHPTPSHPGKPSHPGNPGHPGHAHLGQFRNPGVDVAPRGAELPWQTVRYLRVNNQSGVALTIFGKLTQDGPTYTWTVQPDVTTFLAIDNEKIAAAQVFLWAQSGNRNWMSARDGLTLVSEPYQAENVGVFTYTFNP